MKNVVSVVTFFASEGEDVFEVHYIEPDFGPESGGMSEIDL